MVYDNNKHRVLIRLPINILLALLMSAVAISTAAAAEMYGPYTADVVRIIDGDTVVLNVHAWPGLTQNIHLRLDGVNTPEKRRAPECEKAQGRKATAFTKAFIGSAQTVHISGVHLGKFAGRALGKITVPGKGDLGTALLQAGMAREYHGGHRDPWCVD